MVLSKLHEFHFVIAKSMRNSLKEQYIFKGLVTISDIIVKILTILAPVIKREHNWGEQRMSRYMYVSPDPKEKRIHVHAYLPRKLYRELKLIHQDLNSFSIAQIVRGLLDVFLGLLDEYGENVLQELENMFERWKKDTKAERLTMRQHLRQLWIIVQHLPGKNRLLTLYDRHFSPFWRFRL
ncbi:MAG: hypothetical protein JXB88_12015 [Spirochaetales bacterium]|nr:hypothetical protein [Spirochaetales bacterium]